MNALRPLLAPTLLASALLAAGIGLVACSAPPTQAAPGATTSGSPPAPVDRASVRAPIAPPAVTDEAPQNYPGIHNAVAYHEGFVSGSVPEGDAGFDTLSAMGVKTIISVDGAIPEVERAKAHGIRYIHLPIGYDGFDQERKLQLARATRDAMRDGPVYIHCHHGKHRSAGAAASIAASLGWMTAAEGVERMKVSGTAAGYKGLYACAATSTVLAVNVVDSVPANFPAVWAPSDFVQSMVDIDESMEHLKAIEKAGWSAPADHPDLVPAAEAGRVADLLRLCAGGNDAKRSAGDFAAMMQQGHAQAQALEDLLAAGHADPARASGHFKLLNASCKDCHVKHRD